MKNIKFLFLLVATLFATAFTACQQEWEPGQPDSELSVYFPVDISVATFADVDNEDTVEIDETKTAAFPVYRQKAYADTEMTVDIRSRFLNPDQVVYRESDKEGNVTLQVTVAEAFTVEESVTFAEGEQVAYLYIHLSKSVKSLSIGALYDIEILIKDAMYQGNYGLSRKTFSVGIPETWKNLGDEQTDPDLKLGTYTEDFFVMLYGMDAGNMVYVTVEESEARKGVYRFKNVFSQDNVVALLGGIPSDMQFATGDTYIIVNASDPKAVYLPYQYVGIGIPGYMDQFYIASGRAIGAKDAELVNGVINFPASTVGLLDQSGAGMYTNSTGKLRFTLPGVSMKDYSFAVYHNGTETTPDNSETRAYFEFVPGADVAKYRFIVVEGNVPASEEIKEGTGLNQTTTIKVNENITNLVDAKVDENGALYITDENGEKIYLDDCAESSKNDTTWYISLPKAGLYTLFAVPYNENGEPVKEDDNLKIARTFFYYHPANQNHEGGVPDIAQPVVRLESVANLMGAQYESNYPSCFFLGFDVQCDDAELVTKIMWYYSKTADLPSDIDAYSTEGQMALIAKAGADGDITSTMLADLKTGGNPMLITSTPNTEYTVVLALTSMYGKTTYYTVSGKTTEYYFNVVGGRYEFEEGTSKMTIEIEPFFNATEYRNTGCGELYYINWIVEDNAPDVKVREFPMIAFKMPSENAIITYGQVNGYKGTFFNYDYDKYGDNPDKVWGFESSSRPFSDPMYYATESMVLHYDATTGVINELATYFRQYVRETKVVVENGEEKTVVTTTYPYSFTPAATVSYVEPEVDENTGNETTDEEENTGNEPAPSKMGTCRGPKTCNLQMKKGLSFEAVSIK
ncbi:MAG: hypothetical protein J6U93_02670 [Alistipes sp.]|nr:hypothetical protein [Alistipes sp.]